MSEEFPLGRRLLVAMIAVVAVVAGAAAIAVLTAPPAPGTASFPPRVEDREVITVAAALDIQAAEDGRTIAVGGWYQVVGPPSCPAPMVKTTPLEAYCVGDWTWLMADPERIFRITSDGMEGGGPKGPGIHPIFLEVNPPPSRPLPTQGFAIPTAVVLVGHFDDPRAVDCRDEVRQVCLDRFVVEGVAWVEPGVR